MGFERLPNELLLKIGLCDFTGGHPAQLFDMIRSVRLPRPVSRHCRSILSLRAVNHRFYEVFSDTFYEKFAIPASKETKISFKPAAKAIVNHWTLVLKRLLERGLHVNTVIFHPDEKLCSLLHLAVINCHDNSISKENTEIVRLLLENGANVNGPGKDHYTQYPGLGTPLHRAVDQGNKPVVDVLLEFRADINALDEKGNSPLVYACSQWSIQRFKDIIAILLENGADVKVGNWGLSIPVLDHERWKNEGIVEMLEEAEEDYED